MLHSIWLSILGKNNQLYAKTAIYFNVAKSGLDNQPIKCESDFLQSVNCNISFCENKL